ncbi:MAG: hypothetical protein IPK71_28315 [Myxococcales bacterium]|nr:hypothetical protein [Myxococcales bacterium]
MPFAARPARLACLAPLTALFFVALGACGDTETVADPADAGPLVVACDAQSCECPAGRTCTMTCKAGEACYAKCLDGSTCDVDCGGATDCAARCFDNAKGTIRRKDGASPVVTSAPSGDCKVCLGECVKK